MADSLAGAERLGPGDKKTGLAAMVGHPRRCNPGQPWIHEKIAAGALKIQRMDVQTYFFRRTNMHALSQPRSWMDQLLRHHACHAVDLFHYQTGEIAFKVQGPRGPRHPELKIATDLPVDLKVPAGTVRAPFLSFNDKPIDGSQEEFSMNGIELQDRECFAATQERREPTAGVRQALDAMRTLSRLDQCLQSS